MAIWFTQSDRSGAVRVIDYHEDVGGGLPAVIKVVAGKPYLYGKHWAPHDIEVREIASGLTRKQTAANLGIKFEVTPKIGVGPAIPVSGPCSRKRWNSCSSEISVAGPRVVELLSDHDLTP